MLAFSLACVFSDVGYDVVCVDKDAGKIALLERGHVPIYEQALQDVVARKGAAGLLRFTIDLAQAVDAVRARGGI